MANVEKALYEEKVKAAGVDSTGGDGGGGSSSAENKKIIANTQKIALNLIKSADVPPKKKQENLYWWHRSFDECATDGLIFVNCQWCVVIV